MEPIEILCPPQSADRALLRRLEPERVMVFASWAELEPEEGRPDEAAAEALRERLMTALRMNAEPVLCLYAGEDPAWFRARGDWTREDNLRCYLRYVGRTVRAVGHLASEYVTLYAPNELVWHREKRGAAASFRVLSHMACDHVRAVKLIRDTRQQRGLEDTRVGVALRMAPALELRRALLTGKSRATASGYQKMPLLAMVKGEFIPPMRNALRVRPGEWCDFVGVDCREDVRERVRAEAAELVSVPLWDIRRPEEE